MENKTKTKYLVSSYVNSEGSFLQFIPKTSKDLDTASPQEVVDLLNQLSTEVKIKDLFDLEPNSSAAGIVLKLDIKKLSSIFKNKLDNKIQENENLTDKILDLVNKGLKSGKLDKEILPKLKAWKEKGGSIDKIVGFLEKKVNE